MGEHFIFGYGSLVNAATHDYATAHKARLSGWRRVWRATATRKAAYLNVEPRIGATIDGLVLGVPHHSPDLDLREHAYARHNVTSAVEHTLPNASEINVFAITQSNMHLPSRGNVILLSYVDVVVAGYHAAFGAQGVDDFFASTAGWSVPVLNDRTAPHYPRHQDVGPRIRDLVDLKLAELGHGGT